MHLLCVVEREKEEVLVEARQKNKNADRWRLAKKEKNYESEGKVSYITPFFFLHMEKSLILNEFKEWDEKLISLDLEEVGEEISMLYLWSVSITLLAVICNAVPTARYPEIHHGLQTDSLVM